VDFLSLKWIIVRIFKRFFNQKNIEKGKSVTQGFFNPFWDFKHRIFFDAKLNEKW
jgi:hypothetical protein